ncbi:hypothetical protein ACOZB2_28775 [Pantoea endophytica]|uniref:Secreted protein n=1 Tax=Pantoea sp. BJ2 TaxID=3141322 RepID=A0AAU7U3Z6_9GAMM
MIKVIRVELTLHIHLLLLLPPVHNHNLLIHSGNEREITIVHSTQLEQGRRFIKRLLIGSQLLSNNEIVET